ncbi:Cdc6/Cdc18 family protein [Natrialbaceae archaeon A-chndr2]
MFDRSTPRKNSVLRSEAVLSPSYIPEKPVGRKSEIQFIADTLRPLTHRQQPEHLIVHGPSGTGKTTCVRYVLNHLEKETSTKAVSINCWRYNTRASLLTTLLVRLGYPIPRKGRPIDNLLSKVREYLDKHHGIAVVLDEFDQLKAKTEVFYDLHLASTEAKHSVGIVMVSNQDPSRIQFGPRSRSRLTYRQLEFKPYTTSQLAKLLNNRVEHAFTPGSVSNEIIQAVADRVAEKTGDCRNGLEILLRSGRKANQMNDHKLTREHIEAAI